MSLIEIEQWENENKQHIKSWTADWTFKDGYKQVVFNMDDGSEVEFLLELEGELNYE